MFESKEKDELNNEELTSLFNADQAERENLSLNNLKSESFKVINEERRKKVTQLMLKNKLNTGLDYYHAALIFQHGDKPDDIKKANELAEIGWNKGERKAKKIIALTIDRYLMFTNKQQTYGTQFQYDESEKRWKLWPCDPNTTDDQRREMDVPTLEEIEQSLKNLPNLF